MQLFLCEKPDQGKSIARVLGISGQTNGYLQKGEIAVTWALGHILGLCMPDKYGEQYKNFRNIDALPLIPQVWQSECDPKKISQLNTIKRLLKSATEVVIATDADREGELIARELLEYFHYKGKILRLWLHAQDKASILKGLKNILPGKDKENLYFAALARSHADWLIGMNYSRICSLAFAKSLAKEDFLSVGRVQTPTLALIVRREQAIAAFVPYHHYRLKTQFQTNYADGRTDEVFEAHWQIPEKLRNDDENCTDLVYVQRLVKYLAKTDPIPMGSIISSTTERKCEAAPLPFSLSELQKVASDRFDLSPDKTLSIVQKLYEKYKVTSYPRSPCQYLPISQHVEAPAVLAAVATLNPYLKDQIAKANPSLQSKAWNDNQVNKASHHAIIPTMLDRVDLTGMTTSERQVYELIILRYLAQFYPEYQYDSTIILVDCCNEQFKATGTVPILPGWKELLPSKNDDNTDSEHRLPQLEEGELVTPIDSAIDKKKTTPPKRYTNSSLLDEIKTLSSYKHILEQDKKLKTISKETQGIGTEATRADIIKRLFTVNYVTKRGAHIVSTPKGQQLIASIPEYVCDPITTLKWELSLSLIEEGKVSYDQFMQAITKNIQQTVEYLRPTALAKLQSSSNYSQVSKSGQNKLPIATIGDTCPLCKSGSVIKREFKDKPEKPYLGCSHFKSDKSGCNFFQWMNQK